MYRNVSLVIFVFLVFRFVVPLRAGLAAKTLLALFFFASLMKQQVFLRLGGYFFSPELPKIFIEAYSVIFFAAALLAFFVFCRDVFLLSSWLVRLLSGAQICRRGLSIRAAAFMFAAAALVSAYGVYEAQRQPRVVMREAEIAGLGEEFDGYRIALLSDLHISASRGREWTEELASRVNGLEPDLILLAGDTVDGLPDVRAEDCGPIAELRAGDGVCGVLGNHEYYFGWRAWKRRLEELGVKILINENIVLRRGDGALAVAGLPDSIAVRYGAESPDIAKALSGITSGVPVIIIDHRPASARRNAEAGASVQLSGHTHGGMVSGLRAVVAGYNSGYVEGWYEVGGMKLFVSPGTGVWNGFLLRLGVPSEITLLTLKSGINGNQRSHMR